jgi:hypothetical protein
MPQGSVIPNNAILVAGQPIVLEKEARTITDLAPGRLVITDTTDYQCTYAGADAANVIGVADCPGDKKLTDFTFTAKTGVATATFTAGDQVLVLHGPIRVKAILLSGETVAIGDGLVPAAVGMVKKCTADSGAPEDLVGKAASSSSASATCDWILMDMTF